MPEYQCLQMSEELLADSKSYSYRQFSTTTPKCDESALGGLWQNFESFHKKDSSSHFE